MIKPIIFHNEMEAEETYTFELNRLVSSFLIKNLTDNDIKVSFGEEIDDDSYSILPSKTSEILATSYINEESQRTNKVTVYSYGTGIVEIRLLEY